ncbi:unnamed protein product [Debaryomyces tyrocola]|nr:unnamed protein product [Debaryomyces tyrocola]
MQMSTKFIKKRLEIGNGQLVKRMFLVLICYSSFINKFLDEAGHGSTVALNTYEKTSTRLCKWYSWSKTVDVRKLAQNLCKNFQLALSTLKKQKVTQTLCGIFLTLNEKVITWYIGLLTY